MDEKVGCQKKCCWCYAVKPATDYHNCIVTSDGKKPYCKSCFKKRYGYTEEEREAAGTKLVGYKPSPKWEATCEVCGKQYVTGYPNQKRCSNPCRKKHQQQLLASMRVERKKYKCVCGICGETFLAGYNRKYCSPPKPCKKQASADNLLRHATKKAKGNSTVTETTCERDVPETFSDPEITARFKDRRWFDVDGKMHAGTPRSWYVYGWYSEDDLTAPFYIGQGTGNRAWQVHLVDKKSGEKAFCEMFKTHKTRVVVFRTNLTPEGALLVESVLRNYFRGIGARMANQTETMKRREIPPLEWPE